MPIDSIKVASSVVQSSELMANSNPAVNESIIGVRLIGLIQVLCPLLIIVCLIVGIIYMIKRLWEKELLSE